MIEAQDEHFERLAAGETPDGLRLAEGNIEGPEVLTMLRGLATSVRAKFSPAAWLIVEDREIVGLCSLLGAPDAEGAAAIGYGVAASRRGRGSARRAVADLVHWARSAPAINALTAETSIHNIASQRVLEANGFARIGTRTDPEDGELFLWRNALSVA